MKIYALSAVEAGFDLIHALSSRGVKLTGVISLSNIRDHADVSGFQLATDAHLPADTPVYEVNNYSLKADSDRVRLCNLDIDILVVAGWQRLVPEWLLEHCKLGVIGLHGSAKGISAGRGRSPQNWALITGASSFEIAAFLIDSGIDAGPVLASVRFDYTDHDDIVSSYQKSMLMGAQMIAKVLDDWEGAVAAAETQTTRNISYLPKRIAEDGVIDWTLTATQIRRHVAALTKPYPGATTVLAGHKIIIWCLRPIGHFPLDPPGVAGEIVNISVQGNLIVATGDGYVLIESDQIDADVSSLAVGKIFESRSFTETIDKIVARHEANFPDQPLSPDISELGTGRS